VKENVSDLASGDYQIFMNHIHGTGNGIHTNIANCTIQSNRIDVEQGDSPVEALFSLGHRLATHYKVLLDTETDSNTGQTVTHDHGAVAAFGLALTTLNPNALEVSGKMLVEKVDQWNRLGDVFDGMGTTGVNEIDTLLVKLGVLLSQQTTVPLEPLKQVTSLLVKAIELHLHGFGMILESPGCQVVANRIEALGLTLPRNAAADKKYVKSDVVVVAAVPQVKEFRAPAGIVMTSGTDPASILMYLFLREEITPFYNLGGQGTRFSSNSLQWGAGHGISLSNIPWLVDVRIEGNEIQNHGCAGILSLPVLSMSNLCIKDNEINQCVISKPVWTLQNSANMPVPLGGVMVSMALGVTCSGNSIRACGNLTDGWPAYGVVFVNCGNVDFVNNRVSENGINQGTDEDLGGGAFFWGGSGGFVINNNRFENNRSFAVKVIGRFSYGYNQAKTHIGRIQINGNNLLHDGRSMFAALYVYGDTNGQPLVCTGNQVFFPASVNEYYTPIDMNASDLLFTSNQVISELSPGKVRLIAKNRLLVLGNFIRKDSIFFGQPTDISHNVF
jgi:hypothetical protein